MAKAKKILKALGWTVLGIVAVAAGLAAYIQLTGIPRYEPEKVAFTVRVHAGARGARAAHGHAAVRELPQGPRDGRAHGPRDDGRAGRVRLRSTRRTSRRIAESGIGKWTDSELAYLLRTGITRDGRYTPPWMLKFPLTGRRGAEGDHRVPALRRPAGAADPAEGRRRRGRRSSRRC